jgi:cytochrome P450
MQLLIDDETIFNTNDELIVDQILDLIMAGASTVQLTSLSMLHHISRLPEVRTRV